MDKHIKNLFEKHLKQLRNGYKSTLKERKFQEMSRGNPHVRTEHRKLVDEVEFLLEELKKL